MAELEEVPPRHGGREAAARGDTRRIRFKGLRFPSSFRLSCRSLERTRLVLSVGSNENRGFYRKIEGEKTFLQRPP